MKKRLGVEIAKRVKDGDFIGIGTGSTVDAAIEAMGERIRSEGIKISCVTTSYESVWNCRAVGIQVIDSIAIEKLSWGFDGADAVDSELRVIKGRGGALLREKIVAAKCEKLTIIIDESKLVENICSKAPVPVEIIPESLDYVKNQLLRLGAIEVGLRNASGGKYGSVITERGNLILDASFKEMQDNLELSIKTITGVVESGLFANQADEVLIASTGTELKTLKRS